MTQPASSNQRRQFSAHAAHACARGWRTARGAHPDADAGLQTRACSAELQAFKSHPERPLPLLSESFLADAGRKKFLSDRARVKAMEAYLRFLDKADKDRFKIQLEKIPALSSSIHALLAQHDTSRRYGLAQYAGLLKSIRNVLSNSTDPHEVLSKLADVLVRADEACISKLAGEKSEFPELILSALLFLEQEAPTAWYLSTVRKAPSCRQAVGRFTHMTLKDALQKNALERLFRQIGAEWLRQPFALMALTPQGAEAPFSSR